MNYTLNKFEEDFLRKLLVFSENRYDFDGIAPEEFVDKTGKSLLTEEQIVNFDNYISSLSEKSLITHLENMNGFSDITGCYYFSLTTDAITYFENKKDSVKKQKKLSRREWGIAIVSAIVGAVIGMIPSIIQIIKG